MVQRLIRIGALSLATLAAAGRADTLVRIDFTYATGPGANGTGVTTTTTPVYMDIYASPAITSANFLSYVTSNAYTDSFIHRSLPGFVIQGGGFKFITPTSINYVTTNAPIPLQYTVPNTLGTIAMARTSDDNSATSQWFINLADNSATLGPGGSSADGYAVFGNVLNSTSMGNVNTIAAIPTYDASGTQYLNSSDFSNLPLTQGNLSYDYFVHVSGVVSLGKIGDINHDGKVNIDDLLAFDHSYYNPRTRDVNGDGVFNADDVLMIDRAASQGVSPWGADNYSVGWALGDFNLDGTVDAQDYALLVQAYQQDNPSAPLSAGDIVTLDPFSAVPEPASLSLLMVGGAALVFGRRPRGAKARHPDSGSSAATG